MVIDTISDFIVRRRKGLFWGMLVVIIFLVSGIHHISLNDRFVDYFDERYIIRTDTDYITSRELVGIDIIEYAIKAKGTNGITYPEYLSSLVIHFFAVIKKVTDDMYCFKN